MKKIEPYKQVNGINWFIRPKDFELKPGKRKCQPDGIYMEDIRSKSYVVEKT